MASDSLQPPDILRLHAGRKLCTMTDSRELF